MTLPTFLTIAALARYIDGGQGLSRQRVHWMLRHPDEGDNRQRIKAALLDMRAEFDNALKLIDK